VTYNPDFKVTIIQRQITRKWYNIELHLQWPTNRKSYMIYWTAPVFKVTPFFDAETVRDTDTVAAMDTPHPTVSFRMTLSDLKWLSKIFIDTSIAPPLCTAELLVFVHTAFDAAVTGVPVGVFPYRLAHKTRMMWLTVIEKVRWHVSRFDRMPACDGRTDGRTSCDSVVRAMHSMAR